MELITKHLHIAGQVQGVGYRDAMCRQADELGVTGWVRNRNDGGVEAVVQGTAEAVESIIVWARRGPAAAKVDQVEVSDGSGDYASFKWKSSA